MTSAIELFSPFGSFTKAEVIPKIITSELLLHMEGSGLITPQNIGTVLIDSSPNNHIASINTDPANNSNLEFNPVGVFSSGLRNTLVNPLPGGESFTSVSYKDQPSLILDRAFPWEISYRLLVEGSSPPSVGFFQGGSSHQGNTTFEVALGPLDSVNTAVGIFYPTQSSLNEQGPIIPLPITGAYRISQDSGILRFYKDGIKFWQTTMQILVTTPLTRVEFSFTVSSLIGARVTLDEFRLIRDTPVTTSDTYAVETAPFIT